MENRLNILSLHRLGRPRFRREAVRALEYMLPRYASQHNCIVHDADLAVPDYLQEVDFHAIVLGPTFLCSRYHPRLYERTLEAFDFVRRSRAFKIALPQDEYDCSSILDRWMMDWTVDRLFTVIADHWDVLFPTFSKTGRIRLGYTGYIEDSWIEMWRSPRSHAEREIDVCYRATELPANFGSVGRLKSEIADLFVRGVKGRGLKIDISTNPKDVIPGSSWHAFLENSRFCLVTPSGSSVVDPEGEFRKRVRYYTAKQPNANFAEIAEACFPGEDRKMVLTAVSPRNVESALAETVQIATPGSYSGVMHPMEHYLPLREDGSNISEIVEMMADRDLVDRIRRSCKEAMLSTKRLHARHFVTELVSLIQEEAHRRGIPGTSQSIMETMMTRYAAEIEGRAKRYWRKRELISGIGTVAERLGILRFCGICQGR